MSFTPRQQRVAAKIRHDLAKGLEVPDALFDGLLDHLSHELAPVHWTPVAVARAAVRLLAPGPQSRILDVGSGCGKFCLVASMCGPGRFVGVEQRRFLVEEARDLQTLFGLEGVEFIHGDALEPDWNTFDAFYFYNPFYEHILEDECGPRRRMDSDMEFDPERFRFLTEAVRDRLALCPRGTKVVSFHGFGASLPDSWVFRREQQIAGGYLELLEKVQAAPGGPG